MLVHGVIARQLCEEQRVHVYRRLSTLRTVGPHLRDRGLHHLQGLLEGQLQRLRLPVVLEEHQRPQQVVHLLCRTASVSREYFCARGGAGQTVPLILSTVVTSSLRAYISALSSVGLPSFRLSFFRSALRRFFDDLLQDERGSQSPCERPLDASELRRRSPSYDEMRELLWEYLEVVITLLASE